MQRPTKSNGDSYICPVGFKACNEEFLASAASAEYAICISSSADSKETCPITSFAFNLAGMDNTEASKYLEAKTLDLQSTSKFYFSKSVQNHAIDEVKVSSNTPCWNKN